MSDKNRMKEVIATYGQIRAQYPFWYQFVVNFHPVFSDEVTKAATDGFRLILNPKEWDSWSPELRRFVVLHEMGHVVQRHFSRAKLSSNEIALDVNIAMDIEIHRMFIESGIIPPDWAFGVQPEDSRFDGMPWEKILDILRQENKSKDKKPGEKGNAGSDGKSDQSQSQQNAGQSGKDGKSGQSDKADKSDKSDKDGKSGQSDKDGKSGQSDSANQSGQEKSGENGGSGTGAGRAYGDMSDQEKLDKLPGWVDTEKASNSDAEKDGPKKGDGGSADKSMDERVREMTKQAIERAKKTCPGSVPSWATKWYDENFVPQNSWDFNDAFSEVIQSTFGDVAYTRKRVLTKYIPHNVYLPGTIRQGYGTVVFSIDTSGSMSAESLADCVAQVVELVEKYEFSSYRVITWAIDVADSDSLISSDEVLEYVKNAPTDRGGTSPVKFFEYLRDNVQDVDLIVVFTDGDTMYQKDKLIGHDPNIPVFWVFVDDRGNQQEMPFGTVISKVQK